MEYITDKDRKIMTTAADLQAELVRRTAELIADSDPRDLQELKAIACAGSDSTFMEILHLVVLMADPSLADALSKAVLNYPDLQAHDLAGFRKALEKVMDGLRILVIDDTKRP